MSEKGGLQHFNKEVGMKKKKTQTEDFLKQ